VGKESACRVLDLETLDRVTAAATIDRSGCAGPRSAAEGRCGELIDT
jgi:hypothetical protein